MKLYDVVKAIIIQENISDKDIENTVLYLVKDENLQDERVFRRIVKKIHEQMEYDNAL